jgi:hypothetical protein
MIKGEGCLIIWVFMICSCEKSYLKHPFENATSLDCRNLVVRDAVLSGTDSFSEIVVSIENTCQACVDLPVYAGLYIIDRYTGDTLATSECSSCLSPPANKQSETYVLKWLANPIPSREVFRFSMNTVCVDMPYDRD